MLGASLFPPTLGTPVARSSWGLNAFQRLHSVLAATYDLLKSLHADAFFTGDKGHEVFPYQSHFC